jgi:anti-sigma factor RsiW
MLTPPPDPWPEVLAAYADGELDVGTRQQVETWLADHPEAAELLADQRHLGPGNERWWAMVAPPSPAAAAWERTLDQLAERGRPQPPRWPWLAAGIAVAASVLLAWSWLWPVPTPTMRAEEALVILTDDEVEIHDAPGDALAALIVGHPHPEPLVLAAVHEWTLHAVAPDADGMLPPAPVPADSKVPMIVAPLGR